MDPEIGGIARTGGMQKVAGSVEDHRRPRNLDDGSSPLSLERMMRSRWDRQSRGQMYLTINHATETTEERRFCLVER